MKFHTKNITEFYNVVDEISKMINKSDVVVLNGEIGSGKTTFVKRFAINKNVVGMVTSPTFSILKTYDNKLCHIDAYRINNENLEIEQYIESNYYILIEWYENIKKFVHKIDFEIEIQYCENFEHRVIYVRSFK